MFPPLTLENQDFAPDCSGPTRGTKELPLMIDGGNLWNSDGGQRPSPPLNEVKSLIPDHKPQSDAQDRAHKIHPPWRDVRRIERWASCASGCIARTISWRPSTLHQRSL